MGKASPRTAKNSKPTFLYAVQCGKCFKWRSIPTQEEFEDIRSTFTEDPFYCEKTPDGSCEDPADIDYDSSRVWVADKPNIPKTPEGFHRGLSLRRDFSKFDVHYVTPTGKKLRASTEIASFFQQNPEYEDFSVSDFSFTTPKILEDTLPENIERKGSASANKRIKTLREDDV